MTERKQLKDLIKEAGLTYRELALKMGTSHTMISAWNKGTYDPTLPFMVKLSKELRVSLKVLAASLGEDVTGIPDDCNKGGNEDK
jgi:transcriptional regulator with XRE-family HTH domain